MAASELLERLQSLNAGELSHAGHQTLWKLGVHHVIVLEGIEFLRPTGVVPGFVESLLQKRIVREVERTAAYRRFELLPP